MEILKKYPLPWNVHSVDKVPDDPDSPYSVSVRDSKNKDVFCYVYWDESHEMKNILELVVSSVNKNRKKDD
jgi:hypothetical protein